MKNLVKLIFIATLVFSSSVCLAGKVEEMNELKNNILEPIITHFSDSSSMSRLTSLKLIEMQKADGKFQNLDTNALTHKRTIAMEKVYKEIGKDQYERLAKVAIFCKKYTDRPFTGTPEESTKDFLLTFVSVAWQNNFASCNIYARTVLLAIAFNNLNNVKQGKSLLFREAAAVQTESGFGDHSFVVVEGMSGTMYAIDPWIREVKILYGAKKLSDIPFIPPFIYSFTDDNQNKILNKLFRVEGEDKNTWYYDEVYVREDTKWRLRRDMSLSYQLLANNYDPDPDKKGTLQVLDMKYLENYLQFSTQPVKEKKNILHMEDIYNQLKPYFEKSWKAPYEQLFFKNTNPREEAIEDL
ncbi:MAG: hypothetical protein K0R14_196 [Burkholderiales bacterium]|jgi:hypothetical protein|nr:hypothetical protein [Burkholderiales bacterium]